jgi:hypothetical protein
MGTRLENIIYHKFELNDKIKKSIKLYKRATKKIKIKRISTELKKIIYDKLRLKDENKNKLNFF